MLDTTPGGVNADAYLTVEQADARAAADLGDFAAAWAADVTEALPAGGPKRTKKEAALRQATLDVDEIVEAVMYPYSGDQSLVFPRAEDATEGAPFIPGRIARAVYVQAVYLYSTAEIRDKAAARRARGLSSFSEPNVGGTISTDANFGRHAPAIGALLKLYTEGSVIGRIVRA